MTTKTVLPYRDKFVFLHPLRPAQTRVATQEQITIHKSTFTGMTDINIPPTQSTPGVTAEWSSGTLSMQGDSYPENSFKLFAPLIEWVEKYLADSTAPLRLELRLLYLNTSSVKGMMDIFELLEEAHASGRAVSVTWYYDAENERVAELAEEFKEDCSFPFEIEEDK